MAIVQLKSSHPQFTFLIRKNPSTGMQLRQIRQGMAYGWYSDDSTYNVYFKDADNDISYKKAGRRALRVLERLPVQHAAASAERD
ncbi:hypothetical protein [Cohnella rhizosphaerae]|uniref:hypothetical protein n=1 Tax=Cohnella rhizosphaerae TaxID=1457232 RepID=UPI003B8A703C